MPSWQPRSGSRHCGTRSVLAQRADCVKNRAGAGEVFSPDFGSALDQNSWLSLVVTAAMAMPAVAASIIIASAAVVAIWLILTGRRAAQCREPGTGSNECRQSHDRLPPRNWRACLRDLCLVLQFERAGICGARSAQRVVGIPSQPGSQSAPPNSTAKPLIVRANAGA